MKQPSEPAMTAVNRGTLWTAIGSVTSIAALLALFYFGLVSKFDTLGARVGKLEVTVAAVVQHEDDNAKSGRAMITNFDGNP